MRNDERKDPGALRRPVSLALRATLVLMAGGVLLMAAGTYGSNSIGPVLAGVWLLGVGGVASGGVLLLDWRRVDWLLRIGSVGFIASGLMVLRFAARQSGF